MRASNWEDGRTGGSRSPEGRRGGRSGVRNNDGGVVPCIQRRAGGANRGGASMLAR